MNVVVKIEAQRFRDSSTEDEIGRIWRALRLIGPEWREEGGQGALSESDLLAVVRREDIDYLGGVWGAAQFLGDDAEAVVFVATKRVEGPFWTPAGFRVDLQRTTRDEERWCLDILRSIASANDFDWAYVGHDEAVFGDKSLGFDETCLGRPKVCWANYLSADAYDLDGLEGDFAGADVSVARTVSGALVWVDGVRWDRDNGRANKGLYLIRDVFWRRFPRTHWTRRIEEAFSDAAVED
jgi:hypothetical protein